MAQPSGTWTEERTEGIIGNLLRVGVTVSAALVVLGGALYLARHGTETANYAVFRGEPSDLRALSGIVSDALQFRGRGIVQLGLLVLIATPVARVAFSVFAFARERDRLYVGVTLLVLAVLAFSLAGGQL